MHLPDMATAPTCCLARFATLLPKDRFDDAAVWRASGPHRQVSTGRGQRLRALLLDTLSTPP
jgi:hypothetical protein